MGLRLAGGVAHGQRVRGKIPFIRRRGRVQPVIAVQPYQIAPRPFGDDLGQFGFANIGLALQEHWTIKRQRQKGERRQ